MFKNSSLKFLFFIGITPLFMVLISGCNNKDLEVNQTLVDKGAVAGIVLDKMKDDLFVSETIILKLKSAIDAINVDLEQTQLKSPIDGIVLQILVREGERPNSSGVINVGANQSMEALIEVYESDIDRVQMGQTVDLVSEMEDLMGL